ncbi:MAG: RNA polymerase sigma factor [Fuerstiella sp.]
MTEPDHQPARQQAVVRALASHEGWLKSVIVARLGSATEAEDVLQEVHVAAIQEKSPLVKTSSVSAWLYQLAIRQVLQFRRRAGRHKKRIAQAIEVDSTKPNLAEDPLSWLLSTERQMLVREGLQLLADDDREFLMLKYVEGWSYRKIAERTGRTERAVESQVHRARNRLRKHLVKLDVGDSPETETE